MLKEYIDSMFERDEEDSTYEKLCPKCDSPMELLHPDYWTCMRCDATVPHKEVDEAEPKNRATRTGWREPEGDDEDDFDLKVLHRGYNPDRLTLSISGKPYTFYAEPEVIERFHKIFNLGSKGQALAYLKDNDMKDRIIVMEFDKDIDAGTAQSLLDTLADKHLIPSVDFSTKTASAIIYYADPIDLTHYNLIRNSVKLEGFTAEDVTKPKAKFFMMKVHK